MEGELCVYNDDCVATPDEFEKMAKAYSDSLKEKGFLFVSFANEDYSFLIDEVFEILFKLRAGYRFLNGFWGSNKFLELTENQIDSLRKLFSYNKNRGFRIKTNSTKCLLNSISNEAVLILKLNELAQKSEFFKEISNIISMRLSLLAENYKIEGIFNNPTSLSI